MKRVPAWRVAAALAGIAADPAWAQAIEYTYVRMSLAVPWTLYFVFLGCVLIPFVVMIVLAWRSGASPSPAQQDTTIDEPAGPTS